MKHGDVVSYAMLVHMCDRIAVWVLHYEVGREDSSIILGHCDTDTYWYPVITLFMKSQSVFIKSHDISITIIKLFVCDFSSFLDSQFESVPWKLAHHSTWHPEEYFLKHLKNLDK